jgi:hypothetical protein
MAQAAAAYTGCGVEPPAGWQQRLWACSAAKMARAGSGDLAVRGLRGQGYGGGLQEGGGLPWVGVVLFRRSL